MIKAQHRKPAEWLFKPYIFNLLKTHFSGFYTLNWPEPLNSAMPCLLLPNHSTWWDGFFFYLINDQFFHRKQYLMMLEEQLQKNPFFKYVGAYSIFPGSFSHVKESIQYSISLLNHEKSCTRIVCIFPQGQLMPWLSPVRFQQGIESILKRIEQPIQVCVINMCSVFNTHQYPDVIVKFGQMHTLTASHPVSIKHLEGEANQIKQDIATSLLAQDQLHCFFQGRKSINERFGK